MAYRVQNTARSCHDAGHRMKKSPRYRRKTTKVFDKKKNTAARKQVVPLPEGRHHNRGNIKRKRETGDCDG